MGFQRVSGSFQALQGDSRGLRRRNRRFQGHYRDLMEFQECSRGFQGRTRLLNGNSGGGGGVPRRFMVIPGGFRIFKGFQGLKLPETI